MIKNLTIAKCKVFDLESLTGISPRDSWWSKARNSNVYYVVKDNKTIAFLYLKDAKQFLKGE